MRSYLTHTDREREEMLQAVGARTPEDLFADVPQQVQLHEPLPIPGHDEIALSALFSHMAEKNRAGGPQFLGGGAYRHFIPPVVSHLASQPQFVTAYTPYQAEMSQGLLQGMFEYQSMICALCGMDATNASVYDGATAAAEAMLMSCNVKRKKVFAVSETVPLQVRTVLATYAHGQQIVLRTVRQRDGVTDLQGLGAQLQGCAGILFAQPNCYGVLEDVFALQKAAQQNNALSVAYVNPISLGILQAPGAYADIAVGEGQPLGNPLQFGGPYLGFMAVKKPYLRQLPGRMVGQSVDADGNRGYLLTLQAREQHIRRENATSNICSNQALNALTAAIYLAALGTQGLVQTAQACLSHAHVLSERICAMDGFAMLFDRPFFHECAIACPATACEVNAALRRKGIVGGVDLAPLGYANGLLLCCTECTTTAEMDALVQALSEVVQA